MPARLVACLLLAAASLAWASPARSASDPRAERVARGVLRALGGAEAWAQTRYLAWSFFGNRTHVWDRATGDLRLEGTDYTVLTNVHSREGRAFREGAELTGTALDEALDQAHAAWINDSYWLLMPYKLLDPGVNLTYLGRDDLPDGRPAHVLGLTFEAVGRTPGNAYRVWVDAETDLVEQWAFYRDRSDDEPRFTLPFTGWTRKGRILLPFDHGRDAPWDAEVFTSLPRSVFEDPEPKLGVGALRRMAR